MLSTFQLSGVAAATAIAIAGCASDAATPANVTLQQANQRLIPALCKRLETCKAAEFKATYSDVAGCTSALSSSKDAAPSGEKAQEDFGTEEFVATCQRKIESASCSTVSDRIDCG